MNSMKKNILILESDEGLREAIKLILESDYRLLFVNDEAEAEEHLSIHDISLFIIDVNGLQDAFSALKHIKTLRSDLKILLLSTHFELSFQEAAVKIGHNIYFQEKPFDPKNLKKRIDAFIRGDSLVRHKYVVYIPKTI